MDKPKYYIERCDATGTWYLANPWTGCPILDNLSKEDAERKCAEHNGEQWQPEF